MPDRTLTVRIEAENRARRVLNEFDRSIGRLRRTATAAAAGLTALSVAAGALARSSVRVASTVEQARIRMDSLFGSVERGGRAFASLRAAARRLPQTFEEILQASTALAVVVEQPRELGTRLEQVAEISARFGISLQETASNFVRFATAGAASAELFRERGVLAFLGVQAGAKTSAEESLRLWDEAFERIAREGSSATARLSRSFVGIVGMIEDLWFDIRDKIARAGLFDATKRVLDAIRQSLDDLVASGRIDEFAERFSEALIGAVEASVRGIALVGQKLLQMIAFFREHPLIPEFGLLGLVLFGKKGAVVGGLAGAFAEFLDERKEELTSAIRSSVEAFRVGGPGGLALGAAGIAGASQATEAGRVRAQIDQIKERAASLLVNTEIPPEVRRGGLIRLGEQVGELQARLRELTGEAEGTDDAFGSLLQTGIDFFSRMREFTFDMLPQLGGGGGLSDAAPLAQSEQFLRALDAVSGPGGAFPFGLPERMRGRRILPATQRALDAGFRIDEPSTFTPGFTIDLPDQELIPPEQLEASKERLRRRLKGGGGEGLDLAASAKEVGFDVAQGLVNGIISGSLEFGDILKRFLAGFAAKFLLGPLATALGISSPSQVTRAMGQQLGRGLMLGITDSLAGVRAAAGTLARTAIPRLTSPISRAGSMSPPGVQVEASFKPTGPMDAFLFRMLENGILELRTAGAL